MWIKQWEDKQEQIRVSGQEYVYAYIGHACVAQLYAYVNYKYAYTCVCIHDLRTWSKNYRTETQKQGI